MTTKKLKAKMRVTNVRLRPGTPAAGTTPATPDSYVLSITPVYAERETFWFDGGPLPEHAVRGNPPEFELPILDGTGFTVGQEITVTIER